MGRLDNSNLIRIGNVTVSCNTESCTKLHNFQNIIAPQKEMTFLRYVEVYDWIVTPDQINVLKKQKLDFFFFGPFQIMFSNDSLLCDFF